MENYDFIGNKSICYTIRGKANQIPVIEEEEKAMGIQFPNIEILVVLNYANDVFHFEIYNGFTNSGSRYFQFCTEVKDLDDDVKYVNDTVLNNLESMNWDDAIDAYLTRHIYNPILQGQYYQ